MDAGVIAACAEKIGACKHSTLRFSSSNSIVFRDTLLRALRVLRGSFPVLRRLQVSVDCPRQIISVCMASGAGVSFLVQGFGQEALELLVFSWAYQLHL